MLSKHQLKQLLMSGRTSIDRPDWRVLHRLPASADNQYIPSAASAYPSPPTIAS